MDETVSELDVTKSTYLIPDENSFFKSKIESTTYNLVSSELIIKKSSQSELFLYLNLIKKQDKKFLLEISDNLIEQIDVYYKLDENNKNIISGKVNTSREDINRDRNYIFDIPFELNKNIHILLKIKSHRINKFKLILYSEEGLWKTNRNRNISLGVYYSFMIVPGFIFLISYIGSRSIEYLYYFFYVLISFILHLWIHSTYKYLFDSLSISFNFIYYFNIFFLEWYVFYCHLQIDKSIEKNNFIRKNFIYIFGLNLTFLIPLLREDYQIVSYISMTNLIFIFLFMVYGLIFNIKKDYSKDNRIYLYLWYPIVIGLLFYHERLLGFNFSFDYLDYIFEISNIVQILLMSLIVILKINLPNQIPTTDEDDYNKIINRIDIEFVSNSDKKEMEIINELRQASELQRNLIPIQEKKYPLIDARYYYEYYMEVGGDFFDIIRNENDSVTLYIADASGHGISSALLATLYKISFTNAISKYSSPALIFKEVNQQTNKVLYTHDYLTSFLAVINEDGSMVYASAAHRPAIIYRKNSNIVEVLYAKGLFLGMASGPSFNFEERVEKLEIGDRILFYTDGIFNEISKENWNLEILMKIFVKTSRKNIERALQQIVQEWKSYLPEAKPQDDASFLIIEYTGNK